LKPEGIFLFDTPNRTLASKLVIIKVMQEWRFTRFIDAALHEWAMFIKPEELVMILSRHGLWIGEIVGLGPRLNKPLVLLKGRSRRPPAKPTHHRQHRRPVPRGESHHRHTRVGGRENPATVRPVACRGPRNASGVRRPAAARLDTPEPSAAVQPD
jgi:hypothetical protein